MNLKTQIEAAKAVKKVTDFKNSMLSSSSTTENEVKEEQALISKKTSSSDTKTSSSKKKQDPVVEEPKPQVEPQTPGLENMKQMIFLFVAKDADMFVYELHIEK